MTQAATRALPFHQMNDTAALAPDLARVAWCIGFETLYQREAPSPFTRKQFAKLGGNAAHLRSNARYQLYTREG